MSNNIKELCPVTEESSKFKGVQHVDVEKTVELIKKELGENQKVALVTRQSEISRVGMIMKRVEEEAKAKIVSMKTDYKVQTDKEREFNALFFTAVFARNA